MPEADLGAQPEGSPSPAASISLDMPAEQAGARLREWIGIDRSVWSEPRKALSAWISNAEARDILVVQTHRVSQSEMAGFSVSEWPHPAVALNGSDSHRRRLFTLAHELAHLALNAGGMCDMREDRERNEDEDRIEIYCNRVAAAALMPQAAVAGAASVARANANRRWTTAELDVLAKPFGTSAESMLLRLITLDKATWALYWDLKPQFDRGYAEAKKKRKESAGGPSYYVIKARDLGPGYIRVVLDAFRGRTISSLDVADYLDVRYEQIPRLEEAAR